MTAGRGKREEAGNAKERKIARRVERVLMGGGERHRKAEARRDVICQFIHAAAAIQPLTLRLAILVRFYAVSSSTIRSIHRQHCRLKK